MSISLDKTAPRIQRQTAPKDPPSTTKESADAMAELEKMLSDIQGAAETEQAYEYELSMLEEIILRAAEAHYQFLVKDDIDYRRALAAASAAMAAMGGDAFVSVDGVEAAVVRVRDKHTLVRCALWGIDCCMER